MQLAIIHRWLFFSFFWACFVIFKWLFATVLSLFPWVPSFWMRALLVLSAGPRQPGCSAQPGLASATAASAKTLYSRSSQCVLNIAVLQEPNLCKRDLHLHLSKLPVCLFSQLGTKASDKLREIAPPKCLSQTFTGFYDTRWISDSRKQTIFIHEDAHNCRICSQGSVT